MGDDIASVSLQALEDLATSSSFGQAGLHSVSERPQIRDQRRTNIISRGGRPTVTLRRSSLMNERTRVSRPSDSIEEKRTHRRQSSMRKRKSDELGAIDLADLDSPEYTIPLLDLSSFPQSKNPSNSFGVVFSDTNSQFQQPLQQIVSNQEDEDETPVPRLRHQTSSIFAPPPKKEVETLSTQEKETSDIPDIRATVKTMSMPDTPLFRHYRHQSSSSHESGESPCSVAALTRGCGACFWERSLAWSEDEDDDDDGILHPSLTNRVNDIREQLSVPKHLGKEFIEAQEHYQGHAPHKHIRRASSSRVVTLETDSRRKTRGHKMFRQTDVDKVTEIHWEEKVLDTTAIDLMAQLSL